MKVLAFVLAVASAAPSADEAEHLLLAAMSFDDVAVGYDGHTPAAIYAYRALLRAPDGQDRFARIMEKGTAAGQLYALCGLFFLNPSAFVRHFTRLGESRAPVERINGCIAMTTSVRDAIARDDSAPVMSHGGTIEEWRAMQAKRLDVAGGSTCYRLRYLGSPEDLQAPRK